MRIGLAQMDITWEHKEDNKEKCLSFINQAKNNNIDLLLFPEMTLTGFSMNAKELGETSCETSESVMWFREKAKACSLNLGFGYIEKAEPKAYNNFCIVSKEGNILSNYSKIHPFSFGLEAKYYKGGSHFCLTELEGVTIGSTICYDLRFPELYQILSHKAQVIAIIANWPEARREHWITLLKARAIENQCYILGVNKVGLWGNTNYSGDSMIVDPYGNVLCSASKGEELIYTDIDKKKVLQLREEFKVKYDRREDLYIKGYENILKIK